MVKDVVCQMSEGEKIKQSLRSILNNIIFLKSALLGDTLTATATEVLDHHRIPCIQIEVRNQQDELICLVTGLSYRKDKNITSK